MPVDYFKLSNEGRAFVGAGGISPSAYQTSQHYAEISKMIIHPDYQGKGIGKILLNLLEKEGVGYSDILLDTWDTPSILSFYRKCGYLEAGKIPKFVRDKDGQLHDSYLFTKSLVAR